MSFILEVDRAWPSEEQSVLGVRDGVLVPPESLDDPDSLEFDADYCVVTPGWINAHAHLELSNSPDIDYDGRFLNWIHEVIELKQSTSTDEMLEAYRSATQDLLASGVTRVVDHCDQTGPVFELVEELSLQVHLMKELIAFTDEQVESLKDEARRFMEDLDRPRVDGGLAPHAPYSAHPELYHWAADWIDQRGGNLSSHLHEVRAELEFTVESSGDLMELLRERTGIEVTSPYDGLRPLQYFGQARTFDGGWFGVHLNYLDEADYRWLEATGLCPVFCPRSYSYFNHETLPVTDWIERGIDFALGTDSLASNDSLDMLAELRRLTELGVQAEARTILEALTINPAQVLGVPSRGVLTWGTPADLAVFDVPSGNLTGLVKGDATPLATIVEGGVVWSHGSNG